MFTIPQTLKINFLMKLAVGTSQVKMAAILIRASAQKKWRNCGLISKIRFSFLMLNCSRVTQDLLTLSNQTILKVLMRQSRISFATMFVVISLLSFMAHGRRESLLHTLKMVRVFLELRLMRRFYQCGYLA